MIVFLPALVYTRSQDGVVLVPLSVSSLVSPVSHHAAVSRQVKKHGGAFTRALTSTSACPAAVENDDLCFQSAALQDLNGRILLDEKARARPFARCGAEPVNQSQPSFSSPFSSKFHYAKRRFPVTSKCRQMHGVLNVDEIKN
jgi:hypothetical protein